MTTLIQYTRRHEKTATDEKGQKLDMPTPEGLASAYRKGMQLKKNYLGYQITASHSETDRTRIAATAWLLGAGEMPVPGDNLLYDAGLNSIELTPEEKRLIRNMSDKAEQMRLIFSNHNKPLTEAGQRIARSVISDFQVFAEEPTQKSIEVLITHGPALDAAYLRATGREISYDAANEVTGIFAEGEGFDGTLQKKGRLYVVKFRLSNSAKLETFDLGKLVENVGLR